MLNVKEISICPNPACQTCQLTRQIMDTIGEMDDTDDTQISQHCVALAHAMARRLYGHARENGWTADTERLSTAIDFFAGVIARALVRLEMSDQSQQH